MLTASRVWSPEMTSRRRRDWSGEGGSLDDLPTVALARHQAAADAVCQELQMAVATPRTLSCMTALERNAYLEAMLLHARSRLSSFAVVRPRMILALPA